MMATKQNELADYLSTAQAAAIIGGVDADSVRRYCANYVENATLPPESRKFPAIAAVQIGKAWIIHRAAVQTYLANRRPAHRPKKDSQ